MKAFSKLVVVAASVLAFGSPADAAQCGEHPRDRKHPVVKTTPAGDAYMRKVAGSFFGALGLIMAGAVFANPFKKNSEPSAGMKSGVPAGRFIPPEESIANEKPILPRRRT